MPLVMAFFADQMRITALASPELQVRWTAPALTGYPAPRSHDSVAFERDTRTTVCMPGFAVSTPNTMRWPCVVVDAQDVLEAVLFEPGLWQSEHEKPMPQSIPPPEGCRAHLGPYL